MEKLVYGTEKGVIVMRQLPSLKITRKMQVAEGLPVLTVFASPDRRFLLVGCGDGGLNVITEPMVQISSGTTSLSQTQTLASTTTKTIHT